VVATAAVIVVPTRATESHHFPIPTNQFPKED